MSKLTGITLAALMVLCLTQAGLCAVSRDQDPKQPNQNSARSGLSEAEQALVAASRMAIVQTGVSEAYFDRHYSLLRVTNQQGDRRIVWKLKINEYETIVSDVLGYYTQNGKRVDTHSVTATLRATSEIERTISKTSAIRIMQRCIGKFANVSVEYRPSANDPAQLVLAAEAIPRLTSGKSKGEREREEREARERAQKAPGRKDVDVIEGEGDELPPITTGSVDLETGKCTKGKLLASP